MAGERTISEVQTFPTQPADIVRYLQEALRDMQRRLTEVETSLSKVQYAAPSKLREGMIRFADGTTWNPGSGKGLYIYYSGAWNKLG